MATLEEQLEGGTEGYPGSRWQVRLLSVQAGGWSSLTDGSCEAATASEGSGCQYHHLLWVGEDSSSMTICYYHID